MVYPSAEAAEARWGAGRGWCRAWRAVAVAPRGRAGSLTGRSRSAVIGFVLQLTLLRLLLHTATTHAHFPVVKRLKCGVMTLCAHRDSSARNRRSAGEAWREPHEVKLKQPGGRKPPTARASGEKHHDSLWRLVWSENRDALHILATYQF